MENIKSTHGNKREITPHDNVCTDPNPVQHDRKFELAKSKGIKLLKGWDDYMSEEELSLWYNSTIFPDK